MIIAFTYNRSIAGCFISGSNNKLFGGALRQFMMSTCSRIELDLNDLILVLRFEILSQRLLIWQTSKVSNNQIITFPLIRLCKSSTMFFKLFFQIIVFT